MKYKGQKKKINIRPVLKLGKTTKNFSKKFSHELRCWQGSSAPGTLVWRVGVRPLPTAPCEQVKLDEAQKKRKKIK